jgi:hypothetical protein
LSAFGDEMEAIAALDKQDDARARLSALLAKGIGGWRNMTEPGPDGKPTPIDFAPDRFDRVLSAQEKWELAYTMLRAPRLNDEDKKKSSRQALRHGSSAGPAPETSAPRTSRVRSWSCWGNRSPNAPTPSSGRINAPWRTSWTPRTSLTKGCGWPSPGGWADQTAACVDGVKVAWAAKREIEAREKASRPL